MVGTLVIPGGAYGTSSHLFESSLGNLLFAARPRSRAVPPYPKLVRDAAFHRPLLLCESGTYYPSQPLQPLRVALVITTASNGLRKFCKERSILIEIL